MILIKISKDKNPTKITIKTAPNLIQKESLILDSSGNPVTQAIISVTDASGNLVTGKNLKCSYVKM